MPRNVSITRTSGGSFFSAAGLVKWYVAEAKNANRDPKIAATEVECFAVRGGKGRKRIPAMKTG